MSEGTVSFLRIGFHDFHSGLDKPNGKPVLGFGFWRMVISRFSIMGSEARVHRWPCVRYQTTASRQQQRVLLCGDSPSFYQQQQPLSQPRCHYQFAVWTPLRATTAVSKPQTTRRLKMRLFQQTVQVPNTSTTGSCSLSWQSFHGTWPDLSVWVSRLLFSFSSS